MNARTLIENPRYRALPDVVRLPVRRGVEPSGKPPVRIFLGSEDGQWRAERVFLFSIERVRDPAREYQIHVMKNLAGFDRSRWRTGFTNYRFAIPELAGGSGRAIYNDVDQIYLDDPARLFDLALGEHGYLSVSAEDTSVMLMDCARMLRGWNLRAARTQSKSQLLRVAKRDDGAWGALCGRWNARDAEYPRDEIRLLHYTALHLQPWQPFPETYSYHDHPLGDLWFDLERRADTCGYQAFTCRRPSPRFPCVPKPRDTFAGSDAQGLRRFVVQRGAATALLVAPAPPELIGYRLAPGVTQDWCTFAGLTTPERKRDVVAAFGLAENLPAEDVPWFLDALFARAGSGVFLAVNCAETLSEESVDVRRSLRTPSWWHDQVVAAAERHPTISWQLETTTAAGTTALGSETRVSAPSVWVLEGHRLGDVLQLHRIADALGLPYVRRRLHYNALHMLPGFVLGASIAAVRNAETLAPPWPDLVIASGKRSSGAARWIKEQSGGRTRIVNIGRPWSRLDAFDLIVTTPQYGLPARRNTLHLSLPITSRKQSDLVVARQGSALENLPTPRIAVLVGGSSTSCSLPARAGAELGTLADELAASRGGSLLISGSPRTPKAALGALLKRVRVPHVAWAFGSDGGENPYEEYLALADEIVVTGDSVSMLADALATGRPVRVFPLPPSPLARIVTAVQAPLLWWSGQRRTYRGTPKQQGRAARYYDRLVELGVLTPPRDLAHLNEVLTLRGLVNGVCRRSNRARLADDELRRVVERVGRLLRAGTVETRT